MKQHFYRASAKDFQKIPGSPIAYWLSPQVFKIFSSSSSLKKTLKPKQGTSTGDDETYVRFWHEVMLIDIEFKCKSLHSSQLSGSKYFPLNKGGAYRKWYGNNQKIIRFDKAAFEQLSSMGNNLPSRDLYFKKGLTWSKITSYRLSVRSDDYGFIFSSVGLKGFPSNDNHYLILGFMNSSLSLIFTEVLSPTLSIVSGDIEKLPYLEPTIFQRVSITEYIAEAVAIARADWDNFETSWDFTALPLLRESVASDEEPSHQPLVTSPLKSPTLQSSWNNWKHYCDSAITRMQELETENNRLWIDAYGLQDELTPEVPEDEITLARADASKDMAAFLSYAIGCMMGRYSLDHPGLILADAGDTLEQYFEKVGKSADQVSFLPDDDAIIPITEDDWFEDDAASRVKDFLRITFGADTLEENIRFIEESLGKNLRKYFLTDFYKNHISNERAYGYKKRPIYWMFESPKKHFRALVYLHRYTKDTVNQLLNGYLREFRHKLTHRRDELQSLIDSDTAKPADRKALEKTNAAIKDVEEYERDILLPLAQQRLEIDLDDGVKVNYPKFGKALAKVAGLS